MFIKMKFANERKLTRITLGKAINLHWNMAHYFAFVLVTLRKRGRKRPISVWETQDSY